MSKRKKHKKRPAAKPQTAPTRSARVVAESSPRAAVTARPVVAASSPKAPRSYIQSDVRRIAVLVTGFVALELILWTVFNQTGLGASVYSLIKI